MYVCTQYTLPEAGRLQQDLTKFDRFLCVYCIVEDHNADAPKLKLDT